MGEPDHAYLATLVRQAQAGDTAAFSELYAQTYNKMYNYSRHYLRDDYAAQDAVQDSYILALKNITRINNPMLFTAWLGRIAFHVCFDYARKNTNYQLVDDELLANFYDPKLASDPQGQVELNAEREALERAIKQLPPMQRTVVVMRYYNNMKLNDVADAMDISLSSVKRYLQAAVNTLHSLLSSNTEGGKA